jgi:hypothetical protein
MECIFCTSLTTQVLESRKLIRNRHAIYHRRRECPKCGQRFSTKEEVWDRKTAKVAKQRQSPKGRNAGEKHGMAVLMDENIYEIRDLFAAGVPTGEIAERYGITTGHARDIGSLRRWKHLPIRPNNSDE